MDLLEAVECPFCLARMRIEDRDGVAWLVCANGCATEMEVPLKKPVAIATAEPIKTRAAGQ